MLLFSFFLILSQLSTVYVCYALVKFSNFLIPSLLVSLIPLAFHPSSLTCLPTPLPPFCFSPPFIFLPSFLLVFLSSLLSLNPNLFLSLCLLLLQSAVIEISCGRDSFLMIKLDVAGTEPRRTFLKKDFVFQNLSSQCVFVASTCE